MNSTRATTTFRRPVSRSCDWKATRARRTSSPVRYSPASISVIRPSGRTRRLQRHIEHFLDSRELNYTLEWHLSGEPFLTPVDKLAEATRDAIRDVTGIEPEFSTGGGTSDGRFIAPCGAHVVEFGPINATIHKV